MKKVCIFGDSIGKGVYLPDEGRYKVAKPKLSDTEVKNYSLFGCTVDRALSIVERHADELSEYETVYLELGGNDCDFDWQKVSDEPDVEHTCKTPEGAFKKTYRKIVEIIKKSGGNLILLTFPPIVAERYFKCVTQGRNEENILRWLGSTHTMYRWQEMYNMKVVEIARELDVPMIDIRSAFLEDHHYERLISRDGIHPNEKGYELMWNTISRACVAM